MSREFYNLTPEEARKQVNGKETPLSAEEIRKNQEKTWSK